MEQEQKTVTPLRALRLAKDLTIEQVAEQTGISYRSMERYELEGEIKSMTNLKILAEFYSVPASALL